MNFLILDNATCSQNQVQLYWSEAVILDDEKAYPSRKCINYSKFISRSCNTTEPIGFMNPQMAKTLRGNYFLSTKSKYPYSKPLLQVQAARRMKITFEKTPEEVDYFY